MSYEVSEDELEYIFLQLEHLNALIMMILENRIEESEK